jgi:hypothetical protein
MANHVGERGPEPPRVSLRETFPGDGDGLARESAANNVNCGSSGTGGVQPSAAPRSVGFPRLKFTDMRSESAAIGVGQSLPPFGAGSHVVMAGYLRPVLREYGTAPRIYFDLPGDRHPGAFQAEVKAADAGEQ